MKEKTSDISLADALMKLILRGGNLTINANADHLGEWHDEEFIASRAHTEYMLWKDDAVELLRNHKIKEWRSFFFGDGVPLVKGGLEYSYRDSESTQRLLKNIREETKAKLVILEDIRDRVLNGAPEDNKPKKSSEPKFKSFYLDTKSGELFRYPKELYPDPAKFKTDDGRFKIMKKLIDEKNKGDHFVETNELTVVGEYETNEDCRKAVDAIRCKIEKEFGVPRNDFIIGVQGKGYRIGEEINIALTKGTL